MEEFEDLIWFVMKVFRVKDDGRGGFLTSVLIFVLGLIFFAVFMMTYQIKILGGLALIASTLCYLAGCLGMLWFIKPLVVSFFPYKVYGLSHAFTHVTANSDGTAVGRNSGVRTYWVKKFLTERKAMRYIDSKNHLTLQKTHTDEFRREEGDDRLFVVWDSDVD